MKSGDSDDEVSVAHRRICLWVGGRSWSVSGQM